MQYLDHTFETPQQNLACDEALLDLCEEGYGHEILRCWEPRGHFIVLGYASGPQTSTSRSAAPTAFRCSGAAAEAARCSKARGA
jgi:lipoate-protein ligase A